MPNCAVKLCHNYPTKQNRKSEISYHQFPTNPILGHRWAAIITRTRYDECWKPTKWSVVCSEHFSPDSVYYTKNGSIRLKKEQARLIKMDEQSKPNCQLRRRRCFANPNMALHFDTGYSINEGCSTQGTPSPSYSKMTPRTAPNSARLLQEFKNRQQSFDIQVEDCEEIEILIESDDEASGGDGDGEDNASAVVPNRPVTPTPVQDFGTSVVYTEGPQASDFLKVKVIEQDCYTDVSDAGSEDEDDDDDDEVDEEPEQ